MRRSVHNHGFQKRLPEDFRALVCCWQAKDHWLCCAVPSSPVKRVKVRSGWRMGRIKLEWILCRACSPGDIPTRWFSHLSRGTDLLHFWKQTKENASATFEAWAPVTSPEKTWPVLDWFWLYLAKPCSPPKMDVSSVLTCFETTPRSWWKVNHRIH